MCGHFFFQGRVVKIRHQLKLCPPIYYTNGIVHIKTIVILSKIKASLKPEKPAQTFWAAQIEMNRSKIFKTHSGRRTDTFTDKTGTTTSSVMVGGQTHSLTKQLQLRWASWSEDRHIHWQTGITTRSVTATWGPTLLLQVEDDLVDLVEPAGALRQGDAVARHGVPLAHRDEAALRVLAGLVLQHRGVVDERLQPPKAPPQCVCICS